MNIYIRHLRTEDALISFRWRNDPEIWKWTGSRPTTKVTKEMEKKWIESVLKKNDQYRFAICIDNDNNYVGNVQLTNVTFNRAEFHIFIGEKKCWGQGVGTEASKCVIAFGFEVLKLSEIYLWVNKHNNNAISLYKRIGFISVSEESDRIYMVCTKDS